MTPILFIPWMGVMVYAIWRYGFLRISPGLLAEKILDSVEDLVLLYDTEGKEVYRNMKAKELFGEAKIGPELEGGYGRRARAWRDRGPDTEVGGGPSAELTGRMERRPSGKAI